MYSFSDKPENVRLVTTASTNKACLNDVVNFTCSADAFPQVTSYQLFVNDVPMETDNAGMWSKTLSNSGMFTYKCVGNNTVGSATSASVSIIVKGIVILLFVSKQLSCFSPAELSLWEHSCKSEIELSCSKMMKGLILLLETFLQIK